MQKLADELACARTNSHELYFILTRTPGSSSRARTGFCSSIFYFILFYFKIYGASVVRAHELASAPHELASRGSCLFYSFLRFPTHTNSLLVARTRFCCDAVLVDRAAAYRLFTTAAYRLFTTRANSLLLAQFRSLLRIRAV
jgi:hypothetical protein